MQRSAKEEVARARQTLATEKERLVCLEAEKAEIGLRQEMHEELQKNALEPLKSNHETDNKEKLIADTLAMLRGDNLEESLALAVTSAFRQQPSERSEFSNAALRMLDEAVEARACRLAEELRRVGENLESQVAVITAAAAALAAAETASAECWTPFARKRMSF